MDNFTYKQGKKLELKCPYCGFKINIFVLNGTPEELEMNRVCRCGRKMEDMQEAAERIRKSGIRIKSFYTMIWHRTKDGYTKSYALKKEGIEFKRCGMTLYAYQTESDFPVCYIIDPETGLSIDTVNYSLLSVVPRHISRNSLNILKKTKESNSGEYQKRKKEFQDAEHFNSKEEAIWKMG